MYCGFGAEKRIYCCYRDRKPFVVISASKMHTVTIDCTNIQYYGYSGMKEAYRGYRDSKTFVLQRLPKMHTVANQ